MRAGRVQGSGMVLGRSSEPQTPSWAGVRIPLPPAVWLGELRRCLPS